jgi:site-specific recombinase XerD
LGLLPFQIKYREALAWANSLKKRQYAGITLNCYLSAARGFWRELQMLGLADHNPFRELRNAPYSRPLPEPLTEDQIRSLIAAEQDFKLYVMWVFFYATGFRIDVTRKLKWEQIDFLTSNVKVRGKRDKEILHPIRADLLRLLEGLRQRSDSVWVFPGEKGAAMRGDTIRKHLRSVAKAAGLERDVRPHQLRHSIATHMHERGADIREVQAFLWHENIQTTQIYTQVTTKRLREIINRTHPPGHNFT